MAEVDVETILASVGPVQAVLDAHDGVVNVVSTEGGIISISLEGGCTGCSATPMTAMQIYYSLMKLDDVNDVLFLNGELPEYMRAFIDDKLKIETED
jgi:Fe-S cluster biogenesis protein NfuA